VCCVCVSADPPLVPVQLSSSKAVQVHLYSLSSSGVVKELCQVPLLLGGTSYSAEKCYSKPIVEVSGSWEGR